MSDVEENMFRPRASKLPDVTEEMFKSCNSHNVELVEEYLSGSSNLSPKTLKQYRSAIRQFVYYAKIHLNDKPFYEIKKRDFKRYMSYLINRGMAGDSLKFKKGAVSAFCTKFLEIFIVEDDDRYRTFRNFTKDVVDIPKNHVYEKIPISKDEYELMISTLLDDKNYMACAYVALLFNSGIRRTASTLLKSEIVNYPFEKDKNGVEQNYKLSHYVREKGRGSDGKPVQYLINKEALKYIELWLEKRGYEHEYIFTTGNKTPHRVSDNWANYLCSEILAEIVGRRINPHIFKASAVTNLLEQGVDISIVSKYIAKHEDVSTTNKFYDLRDDEDGKNSIFT